MITAATGLTATPRSFGGLQTAAKGGGSIYGPQKRVLAAPTDPTSKSTPQEDSARQALAALKALASRRSAAGNLALLRAASAPDQFASQRRDAIRKAALEKLALLKAKLKSLMMFGGDPKTRAKMAADIAKEIGKAARDYASAGGTSTSASANAAAADGGGAPAATGAEVANAAAAQSASTAATAASTEGGAGSSDSAAPAAGSAAATGGVAAAPVGSAATSGAAGSASTDTGDDVFIKEARNLARQAKTILQAAVRQSNSLKQKTNVSGQEGDLALAMIDDAADTLARAAKLNAQSSGAGYDASAQSVAATSPPTVTVSA